MEVLRWSRSQLHESKGEKRKRKTLKQSNTRGGGEKDVDLEDV